MATPATQPNVFLSHFSQQEKDLAGSGRPWLDRIRRQAIDHFADHGFPTTRLEYWKFTNPAAIARTAFQPAPFKLDGITAETISRLPGVRPEAARLVFVNNRFIAELSSVEGLPQGVRLGSLAAEIEKGNTVVEEHLTRYAAYHEPRQAFVALNTAFINDGAFVEIPARTLVEKPIQLLFCSTSGDQPVVAQPRNLIVAGSGCQATLIETYLPLGAAQGYFTNAVTEVVAGENAVVEHYRLELEAEEAFHTGVLQVQQARDSNFTSHNVCLGGGLVRNDINFVLNGQGVESTLNGLFIARGRQHIDNHTLVDHAQPHGHSHELYQGILDERGAGVFNGGIIVRPDAQKTDAIQHNQNLLLSEQASINTKPQLEIFADDVKCTHGATIGQIDRDALFYLRTRGVPEENARSLLIYAFASRVLQEMKLEELRAQLEELLFVRLAATQPPEEVR